MQRDPVRIVSLVPSVTESLRAWGIEPVGVTRFCEAPGATKVGGTKNPDLEAIIRLAPDVVVMDREENRSEDATALGDLGVRLHVTHVRSVGDVAPEMASLAEVARVAPPPAMSPSRITHSNPLRAWVPIWRRPWMTIGPATYGTSLLDHAGIVNVCATMAEPYPTIGLDAAAAMQPDVVLAPSEPYRFGERNRPELERVAPVVFVDGQDLFWWGVRTPAAIIRLAATVEQLAPG